MKLKQSKAKRRGELWEFLKYAYNIRKSVGAVMGTLDGANAELNSFLVDKSLWGHFLMPFPTAWQSWLAVLSIPLVLLLIRIVWLVLKNRRERPTWTVTIRSDAGWEKADENVAQIRYADAQYHWKSRFGNNRPGITDSAMLKLNGKGIAARIRTNSKFETGHIELSNAMAKQFNVHNGEKVTVQIYDAWWRLDRLAWRHPDPDVRLQWNMGTIFLIAGVIVPKLLQQWGW